MSHEFKNPLAAIRVAAEAIAASDDPVERQRLLGMPTCDVDRLGGRSSAFASWPNRRSSRTRKLRPWITAALGPRRRPQSALSPRPVFVCRTIDSFTFRIARPHAQIFENLR